MSGSSLAARTRAPVLIYVFCAVVYVAVLGLRARGPSDNTHFVSLAQSYLHGQLSVVGDRPPGNNDWAQYQGRWYVVFPPLPALMVLPAVAIWHEAVWDRLYWALFAGLGPALLYVLLRSLREREGSGRTAAEDLALTALFAFGSAYFYTAVQGTVWFAAHVVACPLIALYVLWSVQARRPLAAGLMLGLAVATRPSTMYLAPIFLIEALSAARPDTAPISREIDNIYARIGNFLRGVSWPRALRSCVLFGLPFAAVVAVTLLLNYLRFGDPFEVGYKYLRIRWSGRIEKWGLFNYHYLAKNLAVYLAALPWLTSAYPFVRISRHGLALWFTTPNYLWVLWPKRVRALLVALAIGAGCTAIADLCYQNSGWIQFAYRFSLDYSVALIALLALGGRRFGPGFYAMLAFACLVNLFGAITFDRMPDFYDRDLSQQVIFQPD
ncbi:MAG TPA: hypothetical protein VMF89_20895 [Polyangiales bacterium]|nr:hypothetical protein [Polyangiales bacterium]